ncbi:gliding motility protein GldB [Kaistella sp. G5-32]|uniref:Gliding motility protein GldB n=1 Tax=Kaistella gelatinilytica TaxID=2787636 RepID=A0ABS0FB64_9FLAO|nr:gliding motility protein GldB [Kaistella gelatinilytica]MBF8456950.1 gliding motility protein GldB [Kaistella gelatinilytica]
MKFFKYLLVSSVFVFGVFSCKKDPKNQWKVEITNPAQKVEAVDISKEFYSANVPLEDFKKKYPWFQGTVPDEDFAGRRADPDEAKVYKEAISKIDIAKLNTELTDLFSHVKYYFPQFKDPKVFLYSSALQGVMEPVFYQTKENMVFIDITGFMGENNPNYKGLEQYFQTSMNPQNIVPKVSEILAENFVAPNTDHQKFIDELIYNGKIMTLQDAFLPNFPDYLKMDYTQKQYEWAKENEVNIWNFFVENNLVFSDDIRLNDRFIKPGPFSKFYTEIDNESSPQVGIYIGWQICKKFFKEKPEAKLTDFLKLSAQEIFNQSHYKPKN